MNTRAKQENRNSRPWVTVKGRFAEVSQAVSRIRMVHDMKYFNFDIASPERIGLKYFKYIKNAVCAQTIFGTSEKSKPVTNYNRTSLMTNLVLINTPNSSAKPRFQDLLLLDKIIGRKMHGFLSPSRYTRLGLWLIDYSIGCCWA